MNPRRFSKSVAAAILAVSMLAIGAAPAEAATTGKNGGAYSLKDTGWG